MTMTSHNPLELTAEHRMLLRMRDTLYEGAWGDFSRDLRARVDGKPHVFETVPTSAAMRDTIAHHLSLIAEMDEWEQKCGETLSADSADAE